MIPIVFDFDGTICHLFRKYNLKNTSVVLQETMRRYGITFSSERDAFDVFDVISAQIPEPETRRTALQMADSILSAAEDEALKICEPVNGVKEIFPQLLQNKNYSVGIATNNSERCVKAFLHTICQTDISVAGRKAQMPELMKPSPWSVLEVATKMCSDVKNIIFVGDSSNDYACARSAGCTFWGMASTAQKKERLLKFIPSDMIVSDFYELWNKLNCLSDK